MRSFVASLCVLLTVVGTGAGASRAAGPGGTFVDEVVGRVREVIPAQWLLVMDNGTALRAQDPHQLDGLRPGVKVRVRFESDLGRKVILRVEPVDR